MDERLDWWQMQPLELWRFDPTVLAMGAEAAFDYADEHTPMEERLGNCYELAAKGLLLMGEGSLLLSKIDLPRPSHLVHGSWHGQGAPARIKHAWVVLSDGRIWEPITALIYDADKFNTYCRTEKIAVYSRGEAQHQMFEHRHWGPWHE